MVMLSSCLPKHMYTDDPIVKALIYFLVKVTFGENTLSNRCLAHLRYDKDGVL